MGILEKLGLNRKKKPFAPFTSEKADQKKKEGLFRRDRIVKSLLTLLFLVFVIGLFPKSDVQELAYSVGEPWREDDLTAPFTFNIFKDEAELRAEEREIRQETPPIFLSRAHIPARSIDMLENQFNRLNDILEAWVLWQESREFRQDDAVSDSILFLQRKNRSELLFDQSTWNELIEKLAGDLINGNSVPSDPQWHINTTENLQNELTWLLNELYADGIVDRLRDDLSSSLITIRNVQERTEQDVSAQHIRTMSEARQYLRSQLSEQSGELLMRLGMQIADLVLEPNLLFSHEDTETLINERIAAISLTKGTVSAGQVIIRRGDIITSDRHAMLESLYRARADRATDIDLWRGYLGDSIVVIAILLIFMFYIYLYRREVFDRNAMLLLVFLGLGLVYAVGAFVVRVDGISPYVVPVAIAPILLTIIFDSRVGIMTTTMLALLLGLMFGNNFEFVVATITACSIGVYSVRDIKDRSQFYLTTPGLIFASYALVLLGFTLTKAGGWNIYMNNLLFLLGNAVGIWLTYPLVLLVEKTFRITTDVTLLELGDTNQPILRRLMLEAPGSFHHSLQVANLSEAAATAIGANSLLCRVGGLYHDIGKLDKPQYFVENQQSQNVHDKLKPRMSALIIKNHVDAGIKLAEEIELPGIIKDFTLTHHGNSLIRYFYEKAMTQSDNEQEIREEDFRYDGPIPNSKETGILMLADSVEAASRSMADHSYQKLENLVNRLVDSRLNEGQLDNCALTLKDLSIIKETFIRILQGMYHGRVKYPGQEEEEKREQHSKELPSGAKVEAVRLPDAPGPKAEAAPKSGASGPESKTPPTPGASGPTGQTAPKPGASGPTAAGKSNRQDP